MQKVIDDIIEERQRQIDICKHGGDTNKFDLSNSKNDWIAYVIAYLGRASDKVVRNENQDYRTNLIKAAALIVAVLEQNDK